MRAVLLRLWRWQSRRMVKAEIDDYGHLYIARQDGVAKGYQWLRWQRGDKMQKMEGVFVNTNQYTTFEDTDDMLMELRRARWAYIWEKVCVIRVRRFRRKLKRY